MKHYFVILLLFVCSKSFSQLNVKNETRSDVWVAIGYYEVNTWYSQGWWKIPPSQTKAVYTNRLVNDKYYIYAEDAKDSRWKGDTYYFCAPNHKFKLVQKDCSSDIQNGFFELYVGQNYSYTLRLTNSSEHFWTESNTHKHISTVKNKD